MGGGSKQKQKTTQTARQDPQFGNLLGRADTMLQDGFYDKEYAGGQQTLAGQTSEQQALIERLTGSGGALELGLGGLEQQLGAYDPNNAALTSAIDMAAGDVTRNLQENVLTSIADSSGQAGQFGSTRHGIAQGIAMRGATEQIGDIATQMRLQDMQAHQQGQQSALANLGNLTAGLEYTAGGEQRAEQSRLDDLFAKWEYESGVGLQDLMAYKGLISGDMGGTQTGKAKGGK